MDDHRKGQQSALRRGRHSCASQIYHITTATRNRAPLFSDFVQARIVIHSMRELHQQRLAETLAFVIMPDHIHWLIQLGEGMPLSTVIKRMKALSSLRAGKRLWQEGFYDHALRRNEDMVEVARYVVANPLRAGWWRSWGIILIGMRSGCEKERVACRREFIPDAMRIQSEHIRD